MSIKKTNKIRLKHFNPLFWFFYFLVVIYRFVTKPFPSRCRFHPTCSTYALECLKEFGFIKACTKTVLRIGKCHPFHPGGVDYPNSNQAQK